MSKLNYLWYDSKIRHKIRRIIARIYDMPNAYRVLDIMDNAGGVDVIEAVNIAGQHIDGYFDVRLKHWLSEEDAKMLRQITLHDKQCKERNGIGSKIFWHIFRNYRKGCRILKTWE